MPDLFNLILNDWLLFRRKHQSQIDIIFSMAALANFHAKNLFYATWLNIGKASSSLGPYAGYTAVTAEWQRKNIHRPDDAINYPSQTLMNSLVRRSNNAHAMINRLASHSKKNAAKWCHSWTTQWFMDIQKLCRIEFSYLFSSIFAPLAPTH